MNPKAVDEESRYLAAVDSLQEVNVSVLDAYERGKTDINFFAALALPTVCTDALPSFYIMIWQLLAQRKKEDLGRIIRFALGLPRGHAKTTFIKILIAWLVVYDKVAFVLIVCANEPLAENLLADLNEILMSENIEAVYGSWSAALSKDSADLKKAHYHSRSVVLAAKGAQSSLRGLNIKNHRPDLIFCDDMQTRENDESPAERQKLLNWFTATLLKTIATRGDRLIIYVGNMYSEECILNRLQMNPKWFSLITGAILADGQPLWPALFSIEDLMDSFEHDESLGQAALWFAEIMNDPIAAKESLLPEILPAYPFKEESIEPDGAFITIDPSGFKKSSDDNVISLHYVIEGKGVVWDRRVGKDISDPEQLVIQSLTMALESGASVIGIEDAGYQSTLQFWFNKYMTDLHISGITIVPLQPKGRTKESRIRVFIQDLYAQNYYLHPRTRPAFVYQATKYKLGKKDNKDDIMDCDAYAIDMRNEYWQIIRNNLRPSLRLIENAESVASVQDDNTPF